MRQLVLPVLVFSLFLVGCAKRPATTAAASAPPPAGGAVATTSPPTTGAVQSAPGAKSLPGTPATPTPGPTTSPRAVAPREFVATAELKDIHFDFDKYDIRPGDARILDQNARWMKANPGHLVLIEGHADERGTNEYNLALGDRRAKATLNYLVAQGVAARRFTTISYGEERPQCAEKTEVCWAQNRRAHLLVKPE